MIIENVVDVALVAQIWESVPVTKWRSQTEILKTIIALITGKEDGS